MKDIIDVDPVTNTVTYDDGSKVDFETFIVKYKEHLAGNIAGETVTHSDMERFMKRGSTKNLKQFGDARKAEGFLEATMDRKMSPEMMRLIIIVVICVVIGVVAYIALKALKIM